METRGWILPLGAGADTVHDRDALSGAPRNIPADGDAPADAPADGDAPRDAPSDAPSDTPADTPADTPGTVGVHQPQPKRRIADEEAGPAGKENRHRHVHVQRKTKKAKIDQGVLRGRPMLQDVVNDVS